MNLRTGSHLINPIQVLEHVGIRERMHIADLGCGALGHYVYPAAKLVGPKGVVYAVDVLREALELLENRALDEQFTTIRYVWSNIETVGATQIPEAVDLCLLANVLCHAQNREAMIQEMARLTKKGGHALVIDWKSCSTCIGPPTECRLSLPDVKRLFEKAPFEFVEEFEAGHAHYGLL